jgi:hypothetical protein
MIILHVNLASIESSVTFVVSAESLRDPWIYHGRPSDCVWMIPGTCDPSED